jgi:hypothetical protein
MLPADHGGRCSDADDPRRRREFAEHRRSLVPFALVRGEFAAADLVFANLECCPYRPQEPWHCAARFAAASIALYP